MAQSNIIMAFRKRLKSYGYTEISIKFDSKKGIYQVEGVEPLGGNRVMRGMSEIEMYHLFRR